MPGAWETPPPGLLYDLITVLRVQCAVTPSAVVELTGVGYGPRPPSLTSLLVTLAHAVLNLHQYTVQPMVIIPHLGIGKRIPLKCVNFSTYLFYNNPPAFLNLEN